MSTEDQMLRNFKFIAPLKLEQNLNVSSLEPDMKKSLVKVNYFLSTMAEKNKKYIKALQNILA